MADDTARRTFLKTIGAAVGAAVTPAASEQTGAAQAARPAPEPAPAAHAYTFFTAPEAAFVEAVADRFIPADDLTPGGTDCGVARFIDAQLAGAWGGGDRMYMQGPWKQGTPSQGYQLPMTPAEFFRVGAAAVAAYCTATFHRDFDRLTVADQIRVLQDLDQEKVMLPGVPARQFFDFLLDLATQGFFADPAYGGNRDKVAWKMVGFPGAIAVYAEHIKNYRNKRYPGEPTSIVDLS